MTDEEIAEEYAEKVVRHKMAVHHIFTKNVTKKEIKDAVIYGLKAGRTKWHKVADGDLPEEEGEYLVCYANESGNFRHSFILTYTEYDEGLHWCDEALESYDEGVIAWCEIPTYTEE